MHDEPKRDPSILSRRQLLKHGACSVAGMAGLHALWNLGLISSAAAQEPGSDYKALVCVFLFGGCDSFNLLVPRDSAHYNPYAAARQNLAIPQNQLLAITPNTSAPGIPMITHAMVNTIPTMIINTICPRRYAIHTRRRRLYSSRTSL